MNNLILALILASLYYVAANVPVCNLDDRDRGQLEEFVESTEGLENGKRR